jgi:hypothetical protein
MIKFSVKTSLFEFIPQGFCQCQKRGTKYDTVKQLEGFPASKILIRDVCKGTFSNQISAVRVTLWCSLPSRWYLVDEYCDLIEVHHLFFM